MQRISRSLLLSLSYALSLSAYLLYIWHSLCVTQYDIKLLRPCFSSRSLSLSLSPSPSPCHSPCHSLSFSLCAAVSLSLLPLPLPHAPSHTIVYLIIAKKNISRAHLLLLLSFSSTYGPIFSPVRSSAAPSLCYPTLTHFTLAHSHSLTHFGYSNRSFRTQKCVSAYRLSSIACLSLASHLSLGGFQQQQRQLDHQLRFSRFFFFICLLLLLSLLSNLQEIRIIRMNLFLSARLAQLSRKFF